MTCGYFIELSKYIPHTVTNQICNNTKFTKNNLHLQDILTEIKVTISRKKIE